MNEAIDDKNLEATKCADADDGNTEETSKNSGRESNLNTPQIILNGRPPTTSTFGTAPGLRRQPTKYPHGLGITVQTITDDKYIHTIRNYSRASTLRSDGSWLHQAPSTLTTISANSDNSQFEENCLRKYRIGMLTNNPENLAELQVRRYKYPLTGNYYLDTQDTTAATKTPYLYEYVENLKRYFRWKYIRWPLIFLASVLFFFGLITYCIWLHDVSVARERYLQRRFQYNLDEDEMVPNSSEKTSSASIRFGSLPSTTMPATITTERPHGLQESTLLRAINTGSRARFRPKEQKLTTKEYSGSASKGIVDWNHEKEQKNYDSAEREQSSITKTGSRPSIEQQNEHVPFTSGHQNSFGVPIEEDERLLRLINGLSSSHPYETTTNSLAKVSPTIPPVPRTDPTATTGTTAQENRCSSTSLAMCQGVLDYDLTYNSTKQLSYVEKAAFENLIHSNCSARAVEFICAALEPECRPSHIGVLPPCRRICKAIMEACSIVIANSDVLTAVFDCSLYPDSTDDHKCEDPTRRQDYCYSDEFECYDSTCIPQQWQCDNIKDCSTGEDEDECLVCDHQEEFRCHSNEKCVPASVRCDLKYDCFDGSDEEDCDDYGSGENEEQSFDAEALNSFPRVYSYASILSPNQTSEQGLYTYITAATDDESGTKFMVHEITNRTSGVSKEEVNNNVPGFEGGPRGFVNFRDSKEIMMTSDSETKFKYSAVRGNRNASRYSTLSTTSSISTSATSAKPSGSLGLLAVTAKATRATTPRTQLATCAPHQLRCVSGKCITVAQLCDKKIDCPDGADELMCTYKELKTTTTSTTALPTTTATPTATATVERFNSKPLAPKRSSRSDKRNLRNTSRYKAQT